MFSFPLKAHGMSLVKGVFIAVNWAYMALTLIQYLAQLASFLELGEICNSTPEEVVSKWCHLQSAVLVVVVVVAGYINVYVVS